MRPLHSIGLVASAMALAGSARASGFNYADVFPGDRAAAMSGAFVALSDDSTGAYYNPAGLVRAQADSVSVSANAFSWRSLTTRNSFFGDDLKAASETFYPSAVASTTRFASLPELSFGFSIVVPNQEDFDSQQKFHPALFDGIDTHFTLDSEESLTTYELGPSVAWALEPELSVGATLYAIYSTSNVRNGLTHVDQLETPGSIPLVTGFEFQSAEGTALGAVAVLGLEWRPRDDLTLALTGHPPGYVHHDLHSRSTILTLSDDGVLVPNPDSGKRIDTRFDEGPPATITPALAWHPNEAFTLDVDVSWYLHRGFHIGGVPVTREGIWNTSAGAEYRVLDRVPLRVGFFTNHTSSPAPKPGDTRFLDHVSDLGFTVGLAYRLDYAELSIGLRESWGDGKSVAVTDVSQVVNEDASETTVFVGSRYQF